VSIQTLAVPGASKEGFVSRDALGDLARSQSAEAFARQYAFPALFVVDIGWGGGAGGGAAPATLRDGPQLMTLRLEGGNPLRYLHEVGFLVKRPGNPFPQFVSVGRAANNDLVFALDSVSKFHGYFTHDGDEWALTDYRSTNGIALNGRKLEPALATPVKNGDRILFGTNLLAEFLDPASLHAKLCG
jgi:hypothetical protein